MAAAAIVESGTGRVVAARLRWARSASERRRGLLGSPALVPGEALVIERAPQVHTFGMAYPIDVVFCARDWRVLHVVHAMRPGRVTRWVFRARYALELPAGGAEGLGRGDRLALR